MNVHEVQQFYESYEDLRPYEKIYSIYLYFVLALTFALVGLCMYVFKRNVKLNRQLRCINIHFIFSCLLLNMALCLWQLIVLPLSINGFASQWSIFKFLGQKGFFLAFWLSLGTSPHMAVVCTMGFSLQSYRLKLSEPREVVRTIFEWLETGSNMNRFLFGSLFCHLFLTFLCMFDAYSRGMLDLEQIAGMENMLHDHPELVVIPIKYDSSLVFLMFICGLIDSAEVVYCIKDNWATFKAVQSTGKIVTSKTFKAQIRMYRLFSLELLTMIILFYIPVAVTSLKMLGVWNVGNLATVNLCIMAAHAPVQIMLVIGFFASRKKVSRLSSTAAASLTQTNKNTVSKIN